MATISDVAKRAGVSKPTVSRYINQKNVSEEKRVRIQEAIDYFAFIPSKLAQSMSSKKSTLIGIIVPDLLNPFFNEMVGVIEQAAAKDNMNCLIFSSQNQLSIEQQSLNVCETFKVKGVILATCCNQHDITHYQIPIVSIDRFLKTSKVNVIVDNQQIGSEIATYFISQGVKNILYIEGDKTIDTSIKRKKSFLESVKTTNIEVDIVSSSYANVGQVYNDLKVLSNIKSYEGIFMGNEIISLALLKLVGTHPFKGLTVDGTYLNDFLLNNIKTIKQPIKAMALCAYQILTSTQNKRSLYKFRIEDTE